VPQSPIRMALTKIKHIDWRHRHTRDALVLLGSVRSLTLRRNSATSPQLLQFGVDHVDWEMDDLTFVVFMLSAAMMISGFCRYQDLSREIKARTAAESEARMMARHTPQTRLPNRRYCALRFRIDRLRQRARHHVSAPAQPGTSGAVAPARRLTRARDHRSQRFARDWRAAGRTARRPNSGHPFVARSARCTSR
jgi:hypothetical protein